jgi:hypothetical protein
MVFALTKTPGGAVYRSPGGVKCNYVPTTVYRYYATPITYSTINLSDFGSWNNSTSAPISYDHLDTVSIPLINGITSAPIGTITTVATCTPRIRALDNLGGFPFASIEPSLQPCTDLPDMQYTLAKNYLITDHTPPKYDGRTLQFVSYGGAAGSPVNAYASGVHSTISGNYYLYPGSSINGMVRIGDNFYPHRVIINVDVDIDTWYNGKFKDSVQTYIIPALGLTWISTTSCTGLDMTATSVYIEHSVEGSFTASYDSCYKQPNNVIIPYF